MAELDATGSDLIWCTYLGGSAQDVAMDITLSPVGCPILVGWVQSTDFPITSNTYDSSHNGYADAFVAKLDPNGSNLLWSTFMGSSGSDIGFGVVAGELGEICIAGRGDDGFPTTAGAYDRTYNGGDYGDAIVARLDLPFISACCIDEVCHLLTEDDCIASGGEYQGDGVECGPDTCVPSDLDEGSMLPRQLVLDPPEPHPVAENLNVSFHLPNAGRIQLRLIDSQGRVVRTLADRWEEAGSHRLSWHTNDGVALGSGIYFMELVSGTGFASRKILVLE